MSGTLTPRHARFYIDTVTFCVENFLFKVPRGPIESESTAFRDMFLLPTDPDICAEAIEGKTDDNPIHLNGIKKGDFELLLSVLLHRTHGGSQEGFPETNDQWESVLRLTCLYGFDTLHQFALNRLQGQMSAVDRIIFGKAYELDFESWTLPAMHEIVRRDEPISAEEGKRLGLEIALNLASVREQISIEGWYPAPGPRPDVKALDFSHILRVTFNQAPSR